MFCEKQVTLVLLRSAPFDIHSAFFIGIHPVFMPELVILHQLPFNACFHLLKPPYPHPSIFCSRRAKAQRITNSAFPHLTSFRRRVRSSSGRLTLVCFIDQLVDQLAAKLYGQPSFCGRNFAPVLLSIKTTMQFENIFAGEALFQLSFDSLGKKKKKKNFICSPVLLKSKSVHLIFPLGDG